MISTPRTLPAFAVLAFALVGCGGTQNDPYEPTTRLQAADASHRERLQSLAANAPDADDASPRSVPVVEGVADLRFRSSHANSMVAAFPAGKTMEYRVYPDGWYVWADTENPKTHVHRFFVVDISAPTTVGSTMTINDDTISAYYSEGIHQEGASSKDFYAVSGKLKIVEKTDAKIKVQLQNVRFEADEAPAKGAFFVNGLISK